MYGIVYNPFVFAAWTLKDFKIHLYKEGIRIEMIKNIIFDMGNVLLDYNPQIPLDEFCSSDEEKDIIRRELFEGPEWIEGDLGNISDKDRYDLIKDRVDMKYHEALKKCAYQWDICMQPVEGAAEFCEYVREKGYNIYVLSNASDLFYEYFPRFKPLDYFDGVVVSCDLHMVKPDRRIYKYILDKYSLKAEECLFIDDREDNVEGANTQGINAVVFRNNYEEIKENLLNGTY